MPYVYIISHLVLLESNNRTEILEHRGLVRVHVFRDRLPMMHREGWTGPKATNAIPFSWFVWERDHRGYTTVHPIFSCKPITGDT